MPRKSRIDAAGALQHIIARRIERGRIFQNEFDRNEFLERLSELIRASGTRRLAWALMDNYLWASRHREDSFRPRVERSDYALLAFL